MGRFEVCEYMMPTLGCIYFLTPVFCIFYTLPVLLYIFLTKPHDCYHCLSVAPEIRISNF